MISTSVRVDKKIFSVVLISLILVIHVQTTELYAQETSKHLFSTWEVFEPDKCASIWLIKRFVDKDAEFLFLKRGELIEKGIPLDTPDAELRRYGNMAVFESIIRKYAIKDEAVIKIGEIIHDIEINTWGEKKFKKTMEVIQKIQEITNKSESNNEVIDKSCKYFDSLYSEFIKTVKNP